MATGRCLCGAVRFQVEGDPRWVGHCHCRSCRRHTGSAVTTFAGFPPDQVAYTRGERAFCASSPGVRRGFCAACGTPLTYESDRFPGEIHLYVCTLDEPERFVPTFHVFYEERVPWLEIHDDLPRHARTSSG
jgi:hypothetical protein